MFDIDGLAKKAKVSRRVVRYFIQRGILPAPMSKEAAGFYTLEHYERLELILELSAKGVPLIKIKEALDSSSLEQVLHEEQGEQKFARESVELVKLAKEVTLMTSKCLFNEKELATIRACIVGLLEEREKYA